MKFSGIQIHIPDWVHRVAVQSIGGLYGVESQQKDQVCEEGGQRDNSHDEAPGIPT